MYFLYICSICWTTRYFIHTNNIIKLKMIYNQINCQSRNQYKIKSLLQWTDPFQTEMLQIQIII